MEEYFVKNMKLKDWAAIWLREKRYQVKESTYANYSIAMVNHIVPLLGEQMLKSIDRSTVQEMVLYLLQHGRLDQSGGLSLKTVKDINNILLMCLRDAQKEKNIYNWKISYPRKTEEAKMLQIISIDDINKMLDCIRKDARSEYLGYAIGIYTGMRIGEICALKWADINMKEKYISVNKTLQRIYLKDLDGNKYSKVVITAPKTPKSKRIIPINSSLYPLLDHARKNHKHYVITGTENYLEPRIYRNRFKIFININGLPDIRFHAIRHTFATRCISSGTDYKTVSELLGHSSVNLTMNLYVHCQMEEKRKCIEMLNTLYQKNTIH